MLFKNLVGYSHLPTARSELYVPPAGTKRYSALLAKERGKLALLMLERGITKLRMQEKARMCV